MTETVDSSEVGKLISYIRGFASKLEASKIRESTMRGRKDKAQQGQLVGGGSAKIYGYDYIKVADKNGGRRAINEAEAKWVRQIFNWLGNDGMSTRAITLSLRKLNAPTKCGGMWGRSSVIQILKSCVFRTKSAGLSEQTGRPFGVK